VLCYVVLSCAIGHFERRQLGSRVCVSFKIHDDPNVLCSSNVHQLIRTNDPAHVHHHHRRTTTTCTTTTSFGTEPSRHWESIDWRWQDSKLAMQGTWADRRRAPPYSLSMSHVLRVTCSPLVQFAYRLTDETVRSNTRSSNPGISFHSHHTSPGYMRGNKTSGWEQHESSVR